MVWLPMTAERWQERESIRKGMGYDQSAEEAVRRNANWLIEHLYEPDAEDESGVRIGVEAAWLMRHEPVNWADLKSSVERLGDIYLVTLDEASPGACPELCAYIHRWLTCWGWQVRVETEW